MKKKLVLAMAATMAITSCAVPVLADDAAAEGGKIGISMPPQSLERWNRDGSYLEEQFKPEYPKKVAEVKSDEYYVNMMRAWHFATALAKQYDQIIPYLEEKRLDTWTHNKTIQKAIESYRITPEQKIYLRTLRVKK